MLDDPSPSPARSALRALVPAAFAVGFLSVYPLAADAVVARLGSGFAPPFVAAYVVTLLLLFQLDAWSRDRRVALLARRAAEQRARNRALAERAEELHLWLDLAAEAEGFEGIGPAAGRFLHRLLEVLPARAASFWMLDDENGSLREAARCPTDAALLGHAEAAQYARSRPTKPTVAADDGEGDLVSVALRSAAAAPFGALVVEARRPFEPHENARLKALAERLALLVEGRVLRDRLSRREGELEAALTTLRSLGARVADEEAREREARFCAEVCARLGDPVHRLLAETSRILRGGGGDDVVPRRAVERLRRGLEHLQRDLARLTGRERERDANARTPLAKIVEEAVELGRGELLAAGVDVRVEAPRAPLEVAVDPVHLRRSISLALRLAAAGLAHAPPPRRVRVRMLEAGPMARVLVEDNGTGLDPRLRGPKAEVDAGDGAEPAPGIRMRTLRRIGHGTTWCIDAERSKEPRRVDRL